MTHVNTPAQYSALEKHREAQREVEVIASIMMRSMFAPHELPLDKELADKYRAIAEAVFNALVSRRTP